MRKRITTLQDALAYQLHGLLYAETKVRDEFGICSQQIGSSEVKNEIHRYVANADDKIHKLDRIFNYLMREPNPRKNEVIVKLIDETNHLLSLTPSEHLKDILMVACIQNINAYKIASYRSAYLFAVELELDTATDLIQQILEWELATSKRLVSLSIHEFNKLNEVTRAK